MEVSKDTKFSLSIETAISVVVSIGMIVGMWFTLQGDIEEAKLLPKTGNGVYAVDPQTTWPPSRNEYKMKDDLQVNKIKVLENDVKELKEELKELREKVYEN